MCKPPSFFAISLQSINENQTFSYIFVIRNNQSTVTQNLKTGDLLGEFFFTFIPLGIQIEIDFHYGKTRIKLHSIRASKRYLNNKSLTHGQGTAPINKKYIKNLLHRIFNRTILTLNIDLFYF